MSAIKTIVSVYIALNIMSASLVAPLIYLDFELRRDYISKVLCINKNKPITVCGGQCYLNAQLTKVTDHQEKEAAASNRTPDFSFYHQAIAEVNIPRLGAQQNVLLRSLYQTGALKRFIGDIFKPPRFP